MKAGQTFAQRAQRAARICNVIDAALTLGACIAIGAILALMF